MDETLLVNRAKDGDLEAFNRLVLAYQDMAYRVAMRMLGDEESAADAVQTAFYASFRHFNTFHGGSFRAWLMRMVCNACYDELRRRKRRPTVPLEPLNSEDEINESPVWIADTGPGPEAISEQKELNAVLLRCLDALPHEFGMVVELVDLEGLDYHEAAAVIGKPLGTVKSRLARGRQRLREGLRRLMPELFEGPGPLQATYNLAHEQRAAA